MKENAEQSAPIDDDAARFVAAIQRGVDEALRLHAALGVPAAIEVNGKVMLVDANTLLQEKGAEARRPSRRRPRLTA